MSGLKTSLKRANQLALIEDIALAIGDGLSVAQACQELQQHAMQQGLKREQRAIEAMQGAVFSGVPMATAMQQWFANDLCMLVSIGERSGLLDQLVAAQRQFEQQRAAAIQGFWRPLIYPFLMLLITMFACYAVGQNVMPKLAGGLPELHWPVLSHYLLNLSSGPWLPLLGLVLIVVLVVTWGPYPLIDLRRAGWRWSAARGAFVIRRYFDGVLLLQSLTVLLRAGTRLDRALQAMQEYGAGSLAYALPELRQRLANGERRLVAILDCGLLSPRMLFRLSNGSRNATEHGTLQRVARYAAADAVAALRRLRVTLQACCYALILGLLLVTVGGMGSMLMAVTQQHVR
ncbi:Toxin coregulated pilus biosynthesis protein E [Pseudidiomarina piscicola]|uniref:Toxin coregulated pilus biosynthesis protein E n=1 Tax=Pseudidiomarina piscicola TaxID=2614830 RepID=A0A6S6WLC2_9GAMM|nr:type II secretion system F family protein [Pseudidiomarina piscicola]CAB0149547.1 Toxin coregulated pilus biosynthesis protein E [Pseudidiomarina piscicola]VZT38995.1 Toxin coregulated pilus biosynthesis protein E [Pseudomonas aeruginosa]